ncbi:MAG: hypothetical protein U1D30_11980 [Planctomycetota bacterium]
MLLERIQKQRAGDTNTQEKHRNAPKKVSKETFLKRGAIISYIVRHLSDRPTFGRTQLEKTLHIAQTHLGIDMEFDFERYAAGPFDKVIFKIEGTAKKKEWFTTQKRSTRGVTYHPGPKIDQMCQYATGYLGNKIKAFDELLRHVARMNTDEAELFATAYAAWNDLLLVGKPATDDAIIAEIHAWHPRKERFSPETIRARLDWMRRNGYCPERD